MSKKVNLIPFLSNNTTEEAVPRHHQPWQWALCKQPKTLSFRSGDDVFKTVNSVFFDQNYDSVETPKSLFTNSSLPYSANSSSTRSEEDQGSAEELIIRGAQSERLFFEPSGSRSEDLEGSSKQGSAEEMILRGAQSERLFFEPVGSRSFLKGEEEEEVIGTATRRDHNDDKVVYKESSVVLAMESEDPYVDFKRSMEEMVESYGLRDWECLEELLGWYLKANGKRNHGFIVGAFVDLLVSMGGASSSSYASSPSPSSASFPSAYTSFSSPSTSSLLKDEGIWGKTKR